MAKDLSQYMNRELIRVVSYQKGGQPMIEELTFEYLDKNDRLRVQADMVREILGTRFQMRPYPAALGRPALAVWASAAACLIGRKHDRGGLAPMADAELMAVVEEVRRQPQLFFP